MVRAQMTRVEAMCHWIRLRLDMFANQLEQTVGKLLHKDLLKEINNVLDDCYPSLRIRERLGRLKDEWKRGRESARKKLIQILVEL